jgi:aminoglycoside phosphotransferase (APT) family kinase protein
VGTAHPGDTFRFDPGVEAAMGVHMARLIRARPGRLVSATAVSTLTSARRLAAAFRFEFADGPSLKGHRCHSVKRAEMVHALLDRAGEGFPPVLAREGDALLLPWVEGQPLAPGAPSSSLLRRCGGILGHLHRVDPPRRPRSRVRTVDDVFAVLGEDVEFLAGCGALDRTRAGRAVEMAAAFRPLVPATGIIHNDFCAENIVVDGTGAPVSVDNITLRIGPLDTDLARTWYRWPLPPHEWAELEAGYREHRDTAAFRAHFPFWAVYVLAVSAASRIRGDVAGHAEPLAQLRRLVDRREGDPPLLP